jgi:hypothetical protein
MEETVVRWFYHILVVKTSLSLNFILSSHNEDHYKASAKHFNEHDCHSVCFLLFLAIKILLTLILHEESGLRTITVFSSFSIQQFFNLSQRTRLLLDTSFSVLRFNMFGV